jgi:hypothetical protein
VVVATDEFDLFLPVSKARLVAVLEEHKQEEASQGKQTLLQLYRLTPATNAKEQHSQEF